MPTFPINKSNSLKSTSEIDAVFKEGSKLSSKLISLYYVKSKKDNPLRFTFSVGKKTHALATTRNKLKRLMKESLRINGNEYLKSNLSYSLVFVYFSSKEESFKAIEEFKMTKIISFHSRIKRAADFAAAVPIFDQWRKRPVNAESMTVDGTMNAATRKKQIA